MPDWLQLSSLYTIISPALRIVVILILALFAIQGLSLAARRTLSRLNQQADNPERLSRLRTLLSVGRSFAVILVLGIAGLMVLQTLDINITPLIAGAGIAGLAISLGAQTLIKDFIGGVLILLENQYNVGDTIIVGDQTGEVVRITLRATYLRDLEGKLRLIPNGDIRSLSNLTSGWARAVVDFNIPYDADMQNVTQALEEAADQAQKDPAVASDLLEKPQVIGWIGHEDWTIKVRLMAKTRPGCQFQVANALRKYGFIALKNASIHLPENGSKPD
jgi:moderate conductance mechanosensitive channel